MTAILVAFLLGLALGLWANRQAVARRSEIIHWLAQDIDRYAGRVQEADAIDRKRERWRQLAIRLRHNSDTGEAAP